MGTPEGRDLTRHLEAEEVAMLAEGFMEETHAEALRRHLAKCRSCMAAYADVVRYRAACLARPELFEGVDPTLRGIRVPRAPVPTAAAPTSSNRKAFLRSAAGLAVGTILVVMLLPRNPAPMVTNVPPAIASALELESSSGLVLPGGEAGASRDRARYRGSGGLDAERLRREVDSCAGLYEGGQRTAHLGYVTGAGLLSLGQIDAARDYAADARRHDPQDPALLALAADVELRSNRLAEAERLARQALSGRPSDPALRLNLAIVLHELGRKQEADRILLPLSEARTFPPIRERARRILEMPAP